jgi:hypothetical protein
VNATFRAAAQPLEHIRPAVRGGLDQVKGLGRNSAESIKNKVLTPELKDAAVSMAPTVGVVIANTCKQSKSPMLALLGTVLSAFIETRQANDASHDEALSPDPPHVAPTRASDQDVTECFDAELDFEAVPIAPPHGNVRGIA